jgi:hypothetical protein
MSTNSLRNPNNETPRVNERITIVRQDRIAAKPNVAGLILRDSAHELEVLNFSSFGILARTRGDKALAPADTLHAIFRFGIFDVQDLKLSVVRVDSAQGLHTYAFEIIGEPLNLDVIQGIDAAGDIEAEGDAIIGMREKLNREFSCAVSELKDWLAGIAERTAEKEKEFAHADPYKRSIFDGSFAQALSAYFRKWLPVKHQKLMECAKNFSGEELKLHADFFRKQLGPLIHQAPFSHRAYNKPRGYAGDFEMMNHLYRNSFEGDNLFARALHHYFINEPAGQAVRNRREYLKSKITETLERCKGKSEIKILSVASGPAKEAQDIVTQLPDDCPPIRWYLLDQDEESLKGAQIEIKRKSKNQKHSFQLMHASIKEVIMRGVIESGFDLVYSAGLFDYFSNSVAQFAAGKLYESVVDGGELIIGNFSLENPTLPLMSMAWDWHLIYRSKADLMELFGNIGPTKIESEPLEINLFAVIKK